MNGNRRKAVNWHAVHNPGRYPPGQIADNIVISDTMQFNYHLFIFLSIIHYQQNISLWVNNHTYPIGHLLFKADVDAARDVKTTKSSSISGIDNSSLLIPEFLEPVWI